MQSIKNNQDILKRHVLPDNKTYKTGLRRQYGLQQWDRIRISEKDPMHRTKVCDSSRMLGQACINDPLCRSGENDCLYRR